MPDTMIKIPEEARHLGRVEAVFPLSKGLKVLIIGLLVLTLILSVAGPVAYLAIPPKPGVTKTVGQAVAVGAVFLGMAALILLVLLYYNRHRLYLFEHGLADIFGSRCRTVAFNDVQEYWDRKGWIRFVTSDGRSESISIRYLQDGWPLKPFNSPIKDLIERKLTPILLPLARKRLASGEEVPFGPISANAYGLTYGKESLPWDEIDDVSTFAVSQKMYDRQLVITRKGHKQTFGVISLYQVPNAMILRDLVRSGRS